MGEAGRDEPLGAHLPDAVLAAPSLTRLTFEVPQRLPDRRVMRRARLRGDALIAQRPKQAHALGRLERQIERRDAAVTHDPPKLAAADRIAAAQQRRQPVLVDRPSRAETPCSSAQPDASLVPLAGVVLLAAPAYLLEVVPLPLVTHEHPTD